MEIIFTNVLGVDVEKPQPAINFIPDWYKKMKPYVGEENKPNGVGGTTSTLKRCMPVFDALTAGYIIESPADVYVSIEDGIQKFEWANFNLISFHGTAQAEKHPAYNLQEFPKWMNCWAVKTPKGYSTLFVQPFHRSSMFTIFPGIVDTDTYSAPVNFPFIINDSTFEGLIPKGTPIVQVIPFKRESWKSKFGGDKEMKEITNLIHKRESKFFNKYKSMFWSKKEYI